MSSVARHEQSITHVRNLNPCCFSLSDFSGPYTGIHIAFSRGTLKGNLVRDGSVNMGTKFAHSDKSVKLGTHVYWTLLFDKINGSTLENNCFR